MIFLSRSGTWLLFAALAFGGCAKEPNANLHPFRFQEVRRLHPGAVPIDLDGDGQDEFVATGIKQPHPSLPNLESVFLLRSTGEIVDQINWHATVLPPHFLDLDADGVLEILVPTIRQDSLFVSVVDATGRKRLSLFLATGQARQQPDGDLPWDPRVVRFLVEDLDRDGKAELVTVVSTGFARHPRGVLANRLPDGAPLPPALIAGFVASAITADVDGDGRAELLLGTVATRNGTQVGALDDAHTYFHLVRLTPTGPIIERTRTLGGAMAHQVWQADLDGDTIRELWSFVGAVGSDPPRLERLDPASGRVLQQRVVPHGCVWATSANLDRGAGLTLVVACQDQVLAFDQRLEIVRQRRLSSADRLQRVETIPDQDGDGLAELLGATAGSLVLLAPDLSIKARLPADSTIRFDDLALVHVFRPSAAQPPELLLRERNAVVALRLVANPWWPVRRFGPPIAALLIGLVTLALVVRLAALIRDFRRSQAIRALALDTAPFGLALLGASGRVEWMNETLRSWLGPPAKVPFDRWPGVAQFVKELGMVDPPHHRAMTTSVDAGGTTRALTVVAEPIGARRRPTDWLVRAEDRAELDHRGEYRTWALMAQRIAHDLKNPLTTMLLTVQRMQREYRVAQPQLTGLLDPYGQRIEERIHQLRRITANFLKLTRVNSPEFEPVALNDFLTLQAEAMRAGLPPDIELKFRPAPEEITVRADREQLQSVVENLVGNAINAMVSGGVLTIAVTSRQDASTTGHAMIEVMDTGTGISAACLARVFEPGFTTSEHGSGLGLAMVKQIAAVHGGTVTVESEPNAGTVVSLALPIVAAPKSVSQAELSRGVA